MLCYIRQVTNETREDIERYVFANERHVINTAENQ